MNEKEIQVLTDQDALYILAKMYFVEDRFYRLEGRTTQADINNGYITTGEFELLNKSQSYGDVVSAYYIYRDE